MQPSSSPASQASFEPQLQPPSPSVCTSIEPSSSPTGPESTDSRLQEKQPTCSEKKSHSKFLDSAQPNEQPLESAHSSFPQAASSSRATLVSPDAISSSHARSFSRRLAKRSTPKEA
eukprot:CAMPEP_0119325898 /NCGR_PEP_ID=MMETSP1333-20130426/66965_1 /TAXON_ID=418940 /ORGANISM="Scyphosphaera apsteinii, Strain RCC1455" /LENGTH=116 /DNA_ID=CAMNT_0007334045 /DNA_START=16 /DNA_END=363 /DNA_ORIENTATION=+